MNTEKAKGKIAASLDKEPRAAVYVGIHGGGNVDLVMAGSEGDNRAVAAVDALAAQIRYLSDAYDVSEVDIAKDAVQTAVNSRGIDADEEVHVG